MELQQNGDYPRFQLTICAYCLRYEPHASFPSSHDRHRQLLASRLARPGPRTRHTGNAHTRPGGRGARQRRPFGDHRPGTRRCGHHHRRRAPAGNDGEFLLHAHPRLRYGREDEVDRQSRSRPSRCSTRSCARRCGSKGSLGMDDHFRFLKAYATPSDQSVRHRPADARQTGDE